MTIDYVSYNELTDKQKTFFIKECIGFARVAVDSHYDDFDEEWDNGWELIATRFDDLVKSGNLEKLYNFIYENKLY